METLIKDLRFGVRMMAKKPGFTLVAMITLALGIGANTAIFSVINAVLLRSLPFPEPDRLLVLAEKGHDGNRMGAAYPNYEDWRARARSFEAMAAFRSHTFNLTGVEKPAQLQCRTVNWNFFQMLGVQAELGRTFIEQDDRVDAARTAVISHGLWQESFGGDPALIGKQVRLDGDSYTVLGVLPPDFELFRRVDLYVPLGLMLTPQFGMLARGNHFGLNVLARLRPGVSVDQARAEIETIVGQLEREYPSTNSGSGVITQELQNRYSENIRPALLVLLTAVGLVLLIACVNVANLLLVRASERQKEIAIRLALGARRARIVRQLLSESVLIALLGGVGGLLIGVWMKDGLLALAPQNVPRLNQVRLDGVVMLFTLGVSVLTGVLFGLLPAWHASRSDLHTTLKEGGRSSGGSSREGMRKTLLVAEVGLSLVLLSGAGLMLRTVFQLTRTNPGFNAEKLLTIQMTLGGNAYDQPRRRMFYDECLTRVQALPGVRSAAMTLSLPIDGSNWNSVFIVGDQPVPPRAELPSSAFTPVSANYFEAMGIRLVKGRAFTGADTEKSSAVTVINETMARRFWSNEDPIGKRLKQGWPEDKSPWREVVGVVSDVKLNGVDQETPLQAYLPLAQEPATGLALVVRTEGAPLRLTAAIEETINAIDKDLPVFNPRSMDQMMDDAIARQRLMMVLLTGFALVALLLAAVGIYGVVSYSVSQRTREIGIRMALGAQARDVMKLVAGQGMMLALIGVLIGLGASLALTQLMKSLLFGVSATDPLTFSAISLLLALVALFACYLPARRATKVDPMVALRYE
ncbi:MAG TPA: ABC transporter permease [Blastocatellia bacterium]|nr:ABC transporter permease [Blastocatellia bacterium]